MTNIRLYDLRFCNYLYIYAYYMNKNHLNNVPLNVRFIQSNKYEQTKKVDSISNTRLKFQKNGFELMNRMKL